MHRGYKIGHADGSRWKMEIFFFLAFERVGKDQGSVIDR